MRFEFDSCSLHRSSPGGPRLHLLVAAVTVTGALVACDEGIPGSTGTRAERFAPESSMIKGLDALMEAERFSGAVLVGNAEEVVFREAYGEADRAADRLNETATRFYLASLGKMFTAVAVLQAVERGDVRLDDRAVDHLPWLRGRVAEAATLHHLLNHTAGLPTEPIPPAASRTTDLRELIESQLADSEPGSLDTFAYANVGFLILGAVLETATGENYHEHVTRAVFDAAQMNFSGFDVHEPSTPDRARGYPRPSSNDEPGTSPYLRGSPAGGSYSTVDDLRGFATALREERLLPASRARQLWQEHAPGYGYGFSVWTGGDAMIVGHVGGTDIASTLLAFDPDSGYLVAVLSNEGDAHSIGAKLVVELQTEEK